MSECKLSPTVGTGLPWDEGMQDGPWDVVQRVVCSRPSSGRKIFWLTGEYTNEEPECTDTDAWALAHGYVAVTPVTVDVTAYRAMDGLKDLEVL